MNPLVRKLRRLVHRPGKEAELLEELEFHLEEEAEARQAAGQSSQQARWAARRELGNLALVAESTRAAWGLDAVLLRVLPVPARIAGGPELAGEGRRARIRVAQHQRHHLWRCQIGTHRRNLSAPALELFRKSPVFSSVFGYYQSWRARNLNLTIGGIAEIGAAEFVPGDFFRGFAVIPVAGRRIVPDDDRALPPWPWLLTPPAIAAR